MARETTCVFPLLKENTKLQWLRLGYKVREGETPVRISPNGYRGNVEYFTKDQCDFSPSYVEEYKARQRHIHRQDEMSLRIRYIFTFTKRIIDHNREKENQSRIRAYKKSISLINEAEIDKEWVRSLYNKTKIMINSL